MTMFKKVFKYDFAYVKRFWWIIAASVLGLSFLGSLVYRFVATSRWKEPTPWKCFCSSWGSCSCLPAYRHPRFVFRTPGSLLCAVL